MKKNIILSGILAVSLLANTISASAAAKGPDSFNLFWGKLKSAVQKKDKAAVANLSKLPFTMPYGVKTIRTRAQFLKSYGQIFNGEADAAHCFSTAKVERRNAKRYEVACGFKNAANGDGGTPIVYQIELTRSGWKLTGLDNINE